MACGVPDGIGEPLGTVPNGPVFGKFLLLFYFIINRWGSEGFLAICAKNAGARMRQPAVGVVSVLLFGLFRKGVAADGREGFFAEVVLDFAGVILGHGGIHPEAD